MKKITAEYRYTPEQLNTIQSLAKDCGLRELTAKILFSRGVDTPEKARRFLHPSGDNFLSPFLMRGMRELVDAVGEVKEKGGLVAVFGDYDADGIGAASILLTALERYGVRTAVHIPERSEGYGMSVEALREMIDARAPDLIVTVDCGVSNREEVEYVKSRGVRVIVTDHHELPEQLPDCTIVNPKLKDDYPYDNLCGAGVAFKVACALLGEDAYDLLDLAAVSTVADSVPLVGENRDIVFEGLKRINTRPRAALKYLLAGKKEEITAQSLAFTVAPRVNAAGRMGDANCALRLFTSKDSAEIYELACKLGEYNLERQQLCDEVYRSAKEQIAESGGAYGNIIMLCGEDWSTGLVGIVAAKIAEEFNRPAILFVKHGDMLKGSARTIENVNIYEALKSCSEFIEEFGGHAQAAGVNVRAENFDRLKNALDDYLGETYTAEDFAPVLSVCEDIDFKIDLALVRELEKLEPCGVGNKKPLFSVTAHALEARRLKDGSPHIAVEASELELVWFGGEKALPLLAADLPKKIVFECGISRFRGEETPRGIVRDMVCSAELTDLSRLYCFRNDLLRLRAPQPPLSAVFESSEKICARIRAARAACAYGLLCVCSGEIPPQFAEAVAGLDVELFRPGMRNAGNMLLVSPAADAEIGMYRDVIFLDRPADFNIEALAGKKIIVNRELCGYNSIAALETSREVMGEIYRALRSGLKGEDSVSAALSAGADFDYRQVVFAAEVFCELGLLRFERGRLAVVRGKRSELSRSHIYSAVCALKEKR